MKYSIRPVGANDNAQLTSIIQTTMTELGAAGPGFSIHDPEVTFISEAYSKPKHAYFVISDGTKIYGGAGVAPLAGSDETICELRKMYFLPEIRGLGLGQQLMERCLTAAKELGFTQCYLETLKTMTSAEKLYVKSGFKEIPGPLGQTGHYGCDRFYLKNLV